MKALALLIAAVALYCSNCTAGYVYGWHFGYRPVATHCPVAANRVYHYYPDLEVYWCPAAGSYAWFENDIWIVTTARPVWLAPTFSFVVIETELHDPWRRHEHYRTVYPRRQVVHRTAPMVVRHAKPNVVIYDRTQGRQNDHDRGNTYIVRENSHDKNIIINPPRPDVKHDQGGRDKHEDARNDRDNGKDKAKVKVNDHNRDGHADNGWVNNPHDERKVTPAQNNRDKENNRNNGNKGNNYTRETKDKSRSNSNTQSNSNRSVGTKKAGKSQANRYSYRK